MSRPKANEAGYEKANLAWKKTMEERCGGKEGVHAFMQKIGAKGGKATGYKGFATNPKLARLAGAVGGRNSKRGKDPMRAERVKKALTLYKEEGKSVEQIAKEMDLSKATVNNYLKEL